MNPNLQQRVASAGFKTWVETEYRALRAREETLNKELRQQMLTTWQRVRPKMYAHLKEQGILEQTADVLQVKMWVAEKAYVDSGMPRTDATEQAEQEWLLMEPEEQDQESEADSQLPLTSQV